MLTTLPAPRPSILSRFNERIRQKESRRFFWVYLAGKMIGLVVALVVLKLLILPWIQSAAHAADDPAAAVPQADIINATNTAWVLIAAFLVFFMQAGFMFLEAGFARERETVNVLLECIVDTCLLSLIHI